MELVFVHLNTPLPKYLEYNLHNCITMFPEKQVVLLHNHLVNPPKIEGLKAVIIEAESRWNKLDQLYSHPKDFRGNFWLTSSARLFALENYIHFTNEEIIHLESDVIVSQDFPFESFHKLEKGLAFPLISDQRGVASVVYIRDKKAAQILTSTLISEARKDPQTTEMLSLKKVYQNNKEDIQILPIGPRYLDAYRNITQKFAIELVHAHSIFNGVFDGSEIGQFYAGTDPRNRRGKILLRYDLVEGFANVKNWTLNYDSTRSFANIGLNGKEGDAKVFALHMPVKDPKIFDRKTQAKVLMQICVNGTNPEGVRISIKILFLAILGMVRRRLGFEKLKHS